MPQTAILLHLQDRAHLDGGLHPDLADTHQNVAEVHQATGLIAVQAAVGLTEALLLLRARAFASERTIMAVAADVVSRRLRFPPDDGHHA
ncbi:MAG: hypothetical protein ABI873_07320 [Marmoricola sp.]